LNHNSAKKLGISTTRGPPSLEGNAEHGPSSLGKESQANTGGLETARHDKDLNTAASDQLNNLVDAQKVIVSPLRIQAASQMKKEQWTRSKGLLAKPELAAKP